MNPLKKLAGDTAMYGLSSIVGRLLNYLLFPLHTMVFVTGDYGIITELYVFAAFLNVIYAFGLETAFFRFTSKYKNDPKVYNTAVSFLLLTSISLSLILVAFDSAIVNAMNYQGMEHFVWIFAGIIALDAIQAIPFARLRYEGKARNFAFAKITGIGTNIFLNLFFLYLCHGVYNDNFLPFLKEITTSIYNPAYNLEYVFMANLFASLASMLFILPYFTKIKLSIDLKILKEMMSFGYPIVFTGLALVTNEMLSRTTLKYWLPDGFYEGFNNQEVLGIFGGVFKLAILMNLGIQAYRYAAEPFFFSQAEKKDSPELFARLFNWFLLFGCLILLGVSINLDILQFLLRSAEYRTAINVVPILLIASLFAGLNYNLSAWYKLIDRTGIGTTITLIGALLTIIGNYILIPHFGYFGSAWAAVIAYGSMTFISYIWSRKLNPFPYNLRKTAIYLTLSLSLIYLNYSYPLVGIKGFFIKNSILIFLFSMIFIKEIKNLKLVAGTKN